MNSPRQLTETDQLIKILPEKPEPDPGSAGLLEVEGVHEVDPGVAN